jgi:hypothetical protein
VPRLRIVVGDAFAAGGCVAGESGVLEVVGAGLPPQRASRARGGGLEAARVAAARLEDGRCGRRPALPRDDLHDAANGVGAEDRALRPAHDLHALHVGQRDL